MPVRMHRTWTVALGCPLVLPFTQPSPLSWQALCTWYSAPRQGGGTDGSGPSDTLVSPGVPQVAVGCSMVAGGRRLCCSPSPGPSCLRCRVAWQATEAHRHRPRTHVASSTEARLESPAAVRPAPGTLSSCLWLIFTKSTSLAAPERGSVLPAPPASGAAKAHSFPVGL